MVARSLGRPRGATACARQATAHPGTLFHPLGARLLADAVSQLQPAGAAFERIGEMVKAGLLTRRRGGHYSITAAGMDMLPKAQAHGPVMTPYRPPTAPPRRPGAMAFAALPSHYARGPM